MVTEAERQAEMERLDKLIIERREEMIRARAAGQSGRERTLSIDLNALISTRRYLGMGRIEPSETGRVAGQLFDISATGQAERIAKRKALVDPEQLGAKPMIVRQRTVQRPRLKVEPSGTITEEVPTTRIGIKQIFQAPPQELEKAPPKVVTIPPKQDIFIETTQKINRLDTPTKRFVGSIFAPALSFASFGLQLGKAPVATLSGIAWGGFTFAKETGAFLFGSGEPPRLATEFGELARDRPEIAAGSFIGEAFLLKGTSILTFRASRFGRATFTRISPRYKPVETITTKFGEEQVLRNIRGIGGTGEIKLVPRGEPPAPKTVGGEMTPPSVRGGFGFTKAEQLKISAQKASGAAVSGFESFFKLGTKTVQLDRELFATPAISGTGFARTSRLGLGQKPAGFLDVLSGDVVFRRTKPQIVAFPEAKGFRGTGKPSTELETTISPKQFTAIQKTGKVGETVIQGERVPIFTGKVLPDLVRVDSKVRTPKPKLVAPERASIPSLPRAKTPFFPSTSVATAGTGIFVKRPTTVIRTTTKVSRLPSRITSDPFIPPSRPVSPFSDIGSKRGLSFPVSPAPLSAPIVSPPTSPPPVISPVIVSPTRPSTPAISTPIVSPPVFSPPAFRPPAIRKGFGFRPFGKKVKGKKGVRPRRAFRRTPSFAAVELGRVSTKPLKFEATGLIERPVLLAPPRRKKKKKGGRR